MRLDGDDLQVRHCGRETIMLGGGSAAPLLRYSLMARDFAKSISLRAT